MSKFSQMVCCFLLTSFLSACGGGGGDSESSTQTQDPLTPVSINGPIFFPEGREVTIQAQDGNNLPSTSYSWRQISGPSADIVSGGRELTLILPSINEATNVTFEVVLASSGQPSVSAQHTIEIRDTINLQIAHREAYFSNLFDINHFTKIGYLARDVLNELRYDISRGGVDLCDGGESSVSFSDLDGSNTLSDGDSFVVSIDCFIEYDLTDSFEFTVTAVDDSEWQLQVSLEENIDNYSYSGDVAVIIGEDSISQFFRVETVGAVEKFEFGVEHSALESFSVVSSEDFVSGSFSIEVNGRVNDLSLQGEYIIQQLEPFVGKLAQNPSSGILALSTFEDDVITVVPSIDRLGNETIEMELQTQAESFGFDWHYLMFRIEGPEQNFLITPDSPGDYIRYVRHEMASLEDSVDIEPTVSYLFSSQVESVFHELSFFTEKNDPTQQIAMEATINGAMVMIRPVSPLKSNTEYVVDNFTVDGVGILPGNSTQVTNDLNIKTR